ncbi:hypothetical protein SAMN05446037_10579 [Anaerovirgula multivorans]|uniref:Uncharacterized protein n=1 Tax=Anaerovirgula multivorans TaxID=312168 RepID=A0A239KWN2_9FIRM|nr:hypothetical protein [Anaerovirgula multivorans]SNT22787.1 hypothetical protein SAMN05446037_10579 [Anaerovirgula multivorans]
MAYIKGEDRNRIIMFPECIDDYISEDNPVRVIDTFVETLDLKELGFKRTEPNEEKIDKYMQALDEEDKKENYDRKPNAQEITNRIKELNERKEKYEEYKKELKKKRENEVSTTDPNVRLMNNNNNNVDVSYNIQTTVDAKHKLIIDFKVS